MSEDTVGGTSICPCSGGVITVSLQGMVVIVTVNDLCI
jgi:hypothetical protein